MSENEKVVDNGMQLIDKVIIAMIFISSFIVIILTIVIVNNKYKRLYEAQMAQLNEIPYNETYKYLNEDKTISFYEETKVIGTYKCINDCKIADFLSSQFIIDNDDLIPITDGNKINLYSISDKKNKIVLDDIPHTSINNKYGTIKIDNKYGVINKKGNIVLDCIYKDVDINTSHIVTLGNNIVYIFGNDAKLITSKTITANGDISISEKNNHLYINIIGTSTTTLIFDTNTNKFIN